MYSLSDLSSTQCSVGSISEEDRRAKSGNLRPGKRQANSGWVNATLVIAGPSCDSQRSPVSRRVPAPSPPHDQPLRSRPMHKECASQHHSWCLGRLKTTRMPLLPRQTTPTIPSPHCPFAQAIGDHPVRSGPHRNPGACCHCCIYRLPSGPESPPSSPGTHRGSRRSLEDYPMRKGWAQSEDRQIPF